jgi:hypothetical protein
MIPITKRSNDNSVFQNSVKAVRRRGVEKGDLALLQVIKNRPEKITIYNFIFDKRKYAFNMKSLYCLSDENKFRRWVVQLIMHP